MISLKLVQICKNRNWGLDTKKIAKSFVEQKQDILKNSLQNSLRVPSEKDNTLYYVNDINEVSSKSTSPLKKRKKYFKTRSKAWPNKSSTVHSIFEKEGLDKNFQEIKNLIFMTKSNKSSRHKRNKRSGKLKKNVSKILKIRNWKDKRDAIVEWNQ